MSTKLIPDDAKVAATRGFIRTASQTLSSIIPIGAITIGTTGDFWIGAALGIAGGIVSAVAAGLASYFSILSKGIPVEYAASITGNDYPTIVEDAAPVVGSVESGGVFDVSAALAEVDAELAEGEGNAEAVEG